ncbi:MAG TPA: 30S ribosomal protein S6 [Candidatus Limnocylindria bacterium]|nr:30S ribosomal protein S6 [Candidatus Limnocylindria bacterium]
MRRYELMLLFRPDLEDDKLQAAVEKVTRAIVNAGGTLTKVSPWGKRRMAYDIQHFREASYFLLHFDIAPSQIRELERGMMISEEILRHLVTLLVDHGSSMSEDDIPPAVVPVDAQAEDDQESPADAQDAEAAIGDDAQATDGTDEEADTAAEADSAADDGADEAAATAEDAEEAEEETAVQA